MIKVLTSYLQLDEFTKNQDKLIFLFAHYVPNEINELMLNYPIDIIAVDPNTFEAVNKKYHVNPNELTLVFIDHNFVIYQTSDKQAIISFLKMKSF